MKIINQKFIKIHKQDIFETLESPRVAYANLKKKKIYSYIYSHIYIYIYSLYIYTVCSESPSHHGVNQFSSFQILVGVSLNFLPKSCSLV